MNIRKLVSYSLSKAQGHPYYKALAPLVYRGITVEEAQETDMHKVHCWLNPKHKPTVSNNSNVTNFVAKKRGKVIGFVQLVRGSRGSDFAGYWLYALAVKLFYRRMGVGNELTRAVIKKAKEEHAPELFLLVRENNNNAIRLYYNLGFRIKIVPALEQRLAEEKRKLGFRRVVMSTSLCNG